MKLIRIFFWHGWNLLKKNIYSVFFLDSFTPIPSNIYIIPSQRCNAKCIMCLNWREKTPLELSFETWQLVIDELAYVAPYSKINISGGEILLPGLLQDIAFYAARRLPYTGIVTNGFLLNKEMVKKVVAAGFSNVNISIDGNSEKIVNMIRGREYAYKTTLKAMELLAKEIKRTKSHMKVIIKPIMMGLNFHELPDLVRKVQKNGLHGVYFQPIEPIYNSKQTFEELKKSSLWIQKKDKFWASQIIDELIEMKKSGFPIINEVVNLEEIKDYFELSEGKNKIFLRRCKIDLSNLFLFHGGGISFCESFPSIGNIQKNTIKEALFSQKAKAQRKLIRRCRQINTCLSTCFIQKSPLQQMKLFLMLNK